MKKIYWSEWKMSDFQLNFKHQFNHSHNTCGACCVSILTGEVPERVDTTLKWRPDCTTEKMVRHLRKKKFDVLNITPQLITSNLARWQWLDDTITDDHVLIFNAETNSDEASWFIFYHGTIWHNFEKWTDSPLFLLRNPPQDILLLRK